MTWQYVFARNARCFLDFSSSSMASRLWEVILPFSALVRVDLEYRIQIWCSQHKKYTYLSECTEESHRYNQRAGTSLL